MNDDEQFDLLAVSDAALIAEILACDKFHVVDYARHYHEIADRTGLDFTTAARAMEQMPLANEGNAHRELRTRSARAASGNWNEIAADMERYIRELASMTFGSEREVDLVSQFSIPIFNHLYKLWSGLSLEEELGISQVFCGRMSLNRRLKVDAGLQRLDAALETAALRVPKDVALNFAILGSDSLVGSLALSLWKVFTRYDGRRISEIAFPEALPATAVPYVDRVANDDIEMHGRRFPKGQRVRLMLHATARAGSDQASDLFFGAGRHLCVGKAMTNLIWRSLVGSLAPISMRVGIGSIVMRRPDHVFEYPQSAKVHLHA